MTYWLIVTTIDNLEVTKKKHEVGISERNRNAFAKVKKGDKCVIYRRWGKKEEKILEPALTGVFEIMSTGHDATRIFQAPPARRDETYPLRLTIRPKGAFRDTFIPFRPLIDKLSFIANKKKWGSYLRGRALIPLSKKDYDIIASLLKKEGYNEKMP